MNTRFSIKAKILNAFVLAALLLLSCPFLMPVNARAETLGYRVEQDLLTVGQAMGCGDLSFGDADFVANFSLKYPAYVSKQFGVPMSIVTQVVNDSSPMIGLGASQVTEKQCPSAKKEYLSLMRKVGLSEKDVEQAHQRTQKAQEEKAAKESKEQEERHEREMKLKQAQEEQRAREQKEKEERLALEQQEKERLDVAWANSIGMKFAPIPGGDMQLSRTAKNDFGEEGVETWSIRVEPFLMGVYEVTQEQWVAVMGTGSNPSGEKGRTVPVHGAPVRDVLEFIRRLNEMEGHQRYRLPYEVEWEYAARAGSTGTYFFGEDSQKLQDYAWHYLAYSPKVQPVGGKRPNPWGLYDIYGNASELTIGVSDYNKYYGLDPAAPAKPQMADPNTYTETGGVSYLSRGGSADDPASECTSLRGRHYGNSYKGFRLVLGPEQAPQAAPAAPATAQPVQPEQAPTAPQPQAAQPEQTVPSQPQPGQPATQVPQPEQAPTTSADELRAQLAQASTASQAQVEQPAASVSPSFDCAKAGTQIELAICADSNLAQMDKGMALMYKQALSAASDKEALRAEQRQWLKQMNEQCAKAVDLNQCILVHYANRTQELGAKIRK